MEETVTARVFWETSVRQWNIANSVSASRALVGIMIPVLAFGGEKLLLLAVLYAGISDWFDGWLARRRHEETSIGRIIDPLADKIFTNVFLIWLATYTGLLEIAILAVITMLYDTYNTYQRRNDIANAFQGKSNKPSKPVTWLSKTKTASLFVLMIYGLYPEWWSIIAFEKLIYFCIFLVLGSWIYSYRS